jgi:hypothetical protein
MKLTKAEMDLLVPAWESRLSRLGDAYLAEVKEAMKVTFIPFIQRQLEIFDHEGGFSSLSSFAMQGSDSLGQPSSHTVTHEASIEEETAETTTDLSSHSTNGRLTDAEIASSDPWLDEKIPTTPLRSPLGALSVDGLSLVTNLTEGMNGGFFEEAMAGTAS